MIQTSPIKIWRKFRNRYRLLGNECLKCKARHYPPVFVCRSCGGVEFKDFIYPPTAKLITWSKVHAGPKGFEAFVPFIIAIVELAGGERMTTQIVDTDEKELKYGLKLQACFRRIYVDGDKGVIHYGIKFKPE